MAFDYINEAFKKLDLLDEQMFDTSLEGINELSSFMDNDSTDDVVRVIDPDAEDAEGIKDSYVGKVIINCNVCHSHVFENKEDIKIEEDGTVNVEKQCPYCGEQEGFTIIGEIAPFNTSTTDTETTEDSVDDQELSDESSEDNTEELMDESYDVDKDENHSVVSSRATRRVRDNLSDSSSFLEEDFKEVSIKTEDQKLEMSSDENGKVTVTTEPISAENSDETSSEKIVPLTAETENEILANNSEVIEEPTVESESDSANIETASEDDSENTEMDFADLDFDEVDEEGVDDLGESYLRKVYENVESFKTTSVSANDHALIVEGIISFASGAKKKTGFIFEARDVNSRGQLRFTGSNKHLAESKDAFSLVGKIDNKKLFVESLKYNYKVNEDTIRGVVRRK